MGEIEVDGIAVGEEVSDADDGGRGDDDEQGDAGDDGKSSGADGVNAQREQCLL